VSPGPTPSPSLAPSPSPSASPSPVPSAEPAVSGARISRVDPVTLTASDLGTSSGATGIGRFETIRVRFRIENPGPDDLVLVPVLEFAPASGSYATVPAGSGRPGAAFYVAREWIAAPGRRGGTTTGPATAAFDPAGHSGPAAAAGLIAVPGVRIMGDNPGPSITVAAGAWTEVEFSVRTTADAAYGASYRLRLGSAGLLAAPDAVAIVTLGAAPALALTPGQLRGIPADPAGAVDDVIRYRLSADAGVGSATFARFDTAPGAFPGYPLVVLASAAVPAPGGAAAGAPGAFASPHGGYSATPAECASCHRAHSSGLPNLVASTTTQATVCFTCHNGTGADANVAATYSDPAIPANDPSTGSYYRHDALAVSDHLSATDNEFQDPPGTPVLNRHSACGDCHNPHKSTGAASTMTGAGWTVPSALAGITGVAVTNGAAGTAPTYTTWTSGSDAHEATLEYELCLKCHSGFTQLPAQAPAAPSTWALDKGLELNPANASTHPVEGAGSNGTAAMAASLTGTSPYKQWNYLVTDTVRCVSCHGDPARFSATSPPDAGSNLAPHASANRGILFQPYRDRVLKGATDSYDATDFALCYVCHTEAPFVDTTGSPRADTNFQYHGLHVASGDLRNKGSGGTSIDTAGDGQGNAICAECHYRIHATAIAYKVDDRSNQRLVNFAPDVVTSGAAWTQTGIAAGSCTLTCHGASHSETYGPIANDLILAVVASPRTFSTAGETVVFRYLVTNATAGTISGPISVSDALVAGISCPSGDLAVGATTTCLATYTVQGADVLLGSATSLATASAGVSSSNTVTTTIVLAP
jgi:predicted CXXCH cytochrome family protein